MKITIQCPKCGNRIYVDITGAKYRDYTQYQGKAKCDKCGYRCLIEVY